MSSPLISSPFRFLFFSILPPLNRTSVINPPDSILLNLGLLEGASTTQLRLAAPANILGFSHRLMQIQEVLDQQPLSTVPFFL